MDYFAGGSLLTVAGPWGFSPASLFTRLSRKRPSTSRTLYRSIALAGFQSPNALASGWLQRGVKKAGVEPKVSAGQARLSLGREHGVYTISDHQQKLEAVKQLESMIGHVRKPRKSV